MEAEENSSTFSREGIGMINEILFLPFVRSFGGKKLKNNLICVENQIFERMQRSQNQSQSDLNVMS